MEVRGDTKKRELLRNPTKIEEIQEKKIIDSGRILQSMQHTQGDTKERMHMWRRTPSTGRNFQTLIIWITVS